MANNENSLVDELRAALKEAKSMSFVHKLHGGPFQPGLPDLLVAMERKAALVEAKWAKDPDFDTPLLDLFATKLTDQQAMNLGALSILDGPLRARALIGGSVESDELPGGEGVLCVAFDIADMGRLREFHTLTLLEITTFLMDLRRGEKTTFGCAHLFQAQIKSRGEKWMAGYLLTGLQYFGPVPASKDKDKTFEDA